MIIVQLMIEYFSKFHSFETDIIIEFDWIC